MQEPSLSISSTDAIFHNAIVKCSKTEKLEIPHAESRNNKVSNGIGVPFGESQNFLYIMFMLNFCLSLNKMAVRAKKEKKKTPSNVF